MKQLFVTLLMACVLAAGPVPAADKHGHDHGKEPQDRHKGQDEAAHGHADEAGESGAVALSDAQRKAAGIVVEPLKATAAEEGITAPGEVKNDLYRSAKVTPRIAAQIIARHARLGDRVGAGDRLVTLSSVEMAQAQGELLVADREWGRVKDLGKQLLSEKRYVEAQVARQQAYARVVAFGMQPAQIDRLLQSGIHAATGEFQLLAARDGTIVNDDFIEGELVEAGRVLFETTDESFRWVEARLPPQLAGIAQQGAAARVRAGEQWFDGKVVQVHHTLDESTRTAGVRIEVANPEDRLHPGQFVQVTVGGEGVSRGLALPERAVLRGADGDQVVYVEQAPGRFRAQEVEVLGRAGGRVLIGGLPPGAPVVVEGAFFLHSELAKAGFDVHAH